MKQEMLEIVLNELLEEQKKETISNAEMISIVKKLVVKLEAIQNHEQLIEILDELKEVNQLNRENTRILIEQEKRIGQLEKRLGLQQPNCNITQIEKLLSTNMTGIKELIANQPHQITKTKRILLFPEHNTMEFYKAFYGRLVKWFAIILLGCFIYALGRDYITAFHQNNWYRKAYEQLSTKKDDNGLKSKPKSRTSSNNSR